MSDKIIKKDAGKAKAKNETAKNPKSSKFSAAAVIRRIGSAAKSNPIVVLLVIVSIIVGCFVPNFFSWTNLGNLISNTSIRFIIALGVSGCLITKGTDLSAGRQVGLAACLAGVLAQRGDYTGKLWMNVPEINIWIVLIIVAAIGIIIGIILR